MAHISHGQLTLYKYSGHTIPLQVSGIVVSCLLSVDDHWSELLSSKVRCQALGLVSRGHLDLAPQALACDLQHNAVVEHPRTKAASPLLLDQLQGVGYSCLLSDPPELSEMAAGLYSHVQIASMF